MRAGTATLPMFCYAVGRSTACGSRTMLLLEDFIVPLLKLRVWSTNRLLTVFLEERRSHERAVAAARHPNPAYEPRRKASN